MDSDTSRIRPRCQIIRGMPGTGKSTLAKRYTHLAHLEEDMFAMKGGRYVWNDADGSGSRALQDFEETVIGLANSRSDFVVASVLPYVSVVARALPKVQLYDDIRGRTAYLVFNALLNNDYEIYVHTCESQYGNIHGCPAHVYEDIFQPKEKFRRQVRQEFLTPGLIDEEKWAHIHWDELMPATQGLGGGAFAVSFAPTGSNQQISNTDYYRLPCGKYLEDFIYYKGLNFNMGSALKYLYRAGKKQGESDDKDRRKAAHYIEYEAECRSRFCGREFSSDAIRHEVEELLAEAQGWGGDKN